MNIQDKIKMDLIDGGNRIEKESVLSELSINKYHPIYKGLVIDVLDMDSSYYVVVYSSWKYEGKPDNSTAFYLHPKGDIEELKEEFVSNLNKNRNGRLYLKGCHGIKYLPIEHEKFVKKAISL